MAASGAVALYHVEGKTPEVLAGEVTVPAGPPWTVDDLAPAYAALNNSPGSDEVDIVSLGCPHASLKELEAAADFLDGRRVRAELWITTARATRDAARQRGLVERIEAAGGRVVADTCLVVAPVADLPSRAGTCPCAPPSAGGPRGFHALATNSAKMAFYAPSHIGLAVRFGPMEQCLEAAVTGRWLPART